MSDNYGVGQRLITAHRYKTALLEQMVCSDLGSALASRPFPTNFCFNAVDIKLTPDQHLKATAPVYKMSIKEKAQKHKPTEWWGWTDSSFFSRKGSKLDGAASLLAADGSLTRCNVWRRAELYVFAVSLSFNWSFTILLPAPNWL